MDRPQGKKAHFITIIGILKIQKSSTGIYGSLFIFDCPIYVPEQWQYTKNCAQSFIIWVANMVNGSYGKQVIFIG